jgi:hypothetical protein
VGWRSAAVGAIIPPSETPTCACGQPAVAVVEPGHRETGAHQAGAEVVRPEQHLRAEERAVVDELNAARDGEYAEVLQRLPALRHELAAETARGRMTYAEP